MEVRSYSLCSVSTRRPGGSRTLVYRSVRDAVRRSTSPKPPFSKDDERRKAYVTEENCTGELSVRGRRRAGRRHGGERWGGTGRCRQKGKRREKRR